MKNRVRGRSEAGFTLIELLIVMIIIGLLASLVAPTMFSKVDSSKRKTAVAQMQMLGTAISAYRLDVGRFPADLGLLLKDEAPNWDGPYMPKEVPLDPWGNAYLYSVDTTTGTYQLSSLGADGREGGEGDAADLVP